LKDNHQIDDKSKRGMGKKKKSTLKTVSEQHIHDLEVKLRKKELEISELQEKLQDKEELVLDLINVKNILDKKIRDLELMELSLKLDDFEKLKMEHRKLEHRTQITKKQLDETRNKIESQKKYVAEAKERVEFMEKVIDDLEKRGFTDLLRNRYPETFIEYQKQ